MAMRKLWRKRWFRAATYSVAVLMVLALAACWFFRIWSLHDMECYRRFIYDGYHPIWRDLAFRRIGEGDTVEEIRQIAKPTEEGDVRNYTAFYYYLPGGMKCPRRIVHLLATDGRVFYAEAGSCFWGLRFFGDLDSARTFWRIDHEQRKQRAEHEHTDRKGKEFHDH